MPAGGPCGRLGVSEVASPGPGGARRQRGLLRMDVERFHRRVHAGERALPRKGRVDAPPPPPGSPCVCSSTGSGAYLRKLRL